ncbi:uncharacterized protein LOC117180148 [Belonocnema kinseyi]|uniref:uncharacterized protein LOC117180148 n=1 Tax=Belonocnema kinseyi TaxID=2817044 RepID=UPI00143D7E41|nr:uncharacterized protein LOC117180148 [Belonocnema kinseyi]
MARKRTFKDLKNLGKILVEAPNKVLKDLHIILFGFTIRGNFVKRNIRNFITLKFKEGDESYEKRARTVKSMVQDVNIDCIESSKSDSYYDKKINPFYAEGAKAYSSRECNKKIQKTVAVENRQNFMKMEKREQDIFLLNFLRLYLQSKGFNEYEK